MPNPLTGDFEAVLQVSGSTVQSPARQPCTRTPSSTPKTPSFPAQRADAPRDDHAFERRARRGAHAQTSGSRKSSCTTASPTGSISRWAYGPGSAPDPGTKPMATYIHGTVHADYRLRDIPVELSRTTPTPPPASRVRRGGTRCASWGRPRDDRLADLVVVGSASDPAARIAQVTRQIAQLLAHRFRRRPTRWRSASGAGRCAASTRRLAARRSRCRPASASIWWARSPPSTT